MNKFRNLLVMLLVITAGTAGATTYYSRATGAWSSSSTWSTTGCGGASAIGTPTVGDIVFICSSNTVTVTANVTVANVTINTGGYLITGGTGGGANKTVTITGTFTINSGGTYEHNNNQLASSTVFAGTEVFSATSNFIVTSWSDDIDRLITGCGSNFGNLTLNWNPGSFIWQNDGLGSTRIIQGNFIVGTACQTLLDQSTANITVPIGGNLTVNGTLWIKYYVNGNLTLTVGGTTTVTGSFYGIYVGDGAFSFTTANFTQTGGTHWGIYAGDGNANYTCPGTFAVSAGDCRGIDNTSDFAAGIINFQIGTFNFTGGTFLASYCCHVGGLTSVFHVTGNMTITYSSTADLCCVNRLATLSSTPTTTALNFTVDGNFTIGGVNGGWNSNNGTGAETDVITGNFSAANGNNYFNSVLTAGNGHTATITVGGTCTISGGHTRLSSEAGTLTATVTGATSITGGTLTAKESTGTGTVNFNSTYSQSGGNFFLHNNSTAATSNIVTVNVQGNFSHTGGIINFDNCASSTAIHKMNLYGAAASLGGSGSMTHASAGTGTVYGELHFAKSGTITASRSTTTHSIQQVKQYVDAVCTVNYASSAQPMQIASNLTQANISTNALIVNGILDMGSVAITANGPSLAAYFSGMTVNGRLRLSRVAGFYDGTTSAMLQPQPFATDILYRMDFNLAATSTVEYYSIVNQAVTGKYPNIAGAAVADVSSAVAAQYHYGNLEINQTGTPGTNFTYPHLPISGTGNVFVRTTLVLTAGEFNLAGSGTGQTVTIENSAASGINRDGTTTVGYIKSEETNGGNNRAKIRWNLGTTTGAHVIPFGVTSGASNFIPFTFNKTTAGSADVLVSTRATSVTSNTPWAAASNVGAVTHMYDPTLGQDGSDEAVIDRWWDITTTAAATATVTFSYRGVENTLIAPYNTGSLGAQHWDGTAWEPPVGSAPAVLAGVGSVTCAGLSTFSPWVLSSLAAPLPVEMVDFTVTCESGHAVIDWTTATETMNNFFAIEKSTDGVNYTQCGRAEGNGTTSEMHDYSFIDPTALTGLTYYRIRQVDYNGESTRTSPVSVNSCQGSNTTVNSWYSSGRVNVEVIGETVGNYEIELLDMQGRVVHTSAMSKEGDVGSDNFSTSELQHGIYLMKVTDPTGVVTTSKICLCE